MLTASRFPTWGSTLQLSRTATEELPFWRASRALLRDRFELTCKLYWRTLQSVLARETVGLAQSAAPIRLHRTRTTAVLHSLLLLPTPTGQVTGQVGNPATLKWLLQDDGFQLALIASCVEVVFFSCQMDQVRSTAGMRVDTSHQPRRVL